LEAHHVAHARLQHRARQRRDPAYAPLRGIGLVHADDLPGLLVLGLEVAEAHRGAEEDLLQTLLALGVDHLGALDALDQEADAAVDLAQALLAVDVVAVLRAVAVARGPGHGLDQLGALEAHELIELDAQRVVAAPRHVVLAASRQALRGGEFLVTVVGAVAFLHEGFVHLRSFRVAEGRMVRNPPRTRHVRTWRHDGRERGQERSCHPPRRRITSLPSHGAHLHAARRSAKTIQKRHTGDASMTDKAFDEVTSLRLRLDEMRLEHRDLDDAIVTLAASPTGDELMLRRLKKRKLALKDRIIAIEHMLSPDERA